jgi:hypothetical protein
MDEQEKKAKKNYGLWSEAAAVCHNMIIISKKLISQNSFFNRCI